MNNYTFSLDSNPLTIEEKNYLQGHMNELQLNESIWKLYETFLQTTTKNSIPLILRMRSGEELVAAVIIIKCFDHGSTLTGFKPAITLMRFLRLPAYVWMRSGIAAELLANPGFINVRYDPGEILPALMDYIRKNLFLSFILDLAENKSMHTGSTQLPYPDEGIIDMENVLDHENYIRLHKNIKKKLRYFKNKGGIVQVFKGRLSNDEIELVGKCVESTSKHSVFKLPYQENYPSMCMASASLDDENVVHFICRSETDFLGYHSFLDFGTHLRCLNGAFNRELKTTHHAYENMIARVVEYANDNGIKRIYFGPVLNETKRRMMHEFQPTSIHFNSNNALIRNIFPIILKNSRMMNKSVMQFRDL